MPTPRKSRTRPAAKVRSPRRQKVVKASKPRPDVLNVDQLGALVGIGAFEDIEDSDAYHWAYKQAIDDGDTEQEAEKAAVEAEQEEQRERFVSWHNDLTNAADHLFAQHGLVLVPQGRGDHPWEYKVVPEKSWTDAANQIRNTINGVGMFEFGSLRDFLASGPYTTRQAALSHLHWMKDWYEVYGERRPGRRR